MIIRGETHKWSDAGENDQPVDAVYYWSFKPGEEDFLLSAAATAINWTRRNGGENSVQLPPFKGDPDDQIRQYKRRELEDVLEDIGEGRKFGPRTSNTILRAFNAARLHKRLVDGSPHRFGDFYFSAAELRNLREAAEQVRGAYAAGKSAVDRLLHLAWIPEVERFDLKLPEGFELGGNSESRSSSPTSVWAEVDTSSISAIQEAMKKRKALKKAGIVVN